MGAGVAGVFFLHQWRHWRRRVTRLRHRLTLAQRLQFGVGIGAVVIVIVSIVAALLIRLMTDTVSTTVEQVRFGQQTAVAMKDALSLESESVQGYLIVGDSSAPSTSGDPSVNGAKLLERFATGHTNFVAAAQRLRDLQQARVELGNAGAKTDLATVGQITALEAEYHTKAEQVIDLSREGFPAAASFQWQTEGVPKSDALRGQLDQVVAGRLQAVQDAVDAAHRRETYTQVVFLPVVALTVVAGILSAFFTGRGIGRRIGRLQRTISGIEQGDFNVELEDGGRDELGQLAASIRTMAQALERETRESDALLAERIRANERVTALYDVARTVNQAIEPQEVLCLALTKLLAHTRMQAGVALLRDADSSLFHIAHTDGISEEMAAYFHGLVNERMIQEFTAGVMAHEGLTRVNLRNPPIESQTFLTGIGVPLRAQGEDLGVLFLLTTEDVTISSDETQLIEGLGKQIGTSLEHARLYERSRRLAVTEERNRLARDLHDSVTQSLFSISMMAQALPSLIERGPGRALERATRLSDLARGALAEMRMLILELRPDSLHEMGLPTALERHVAGFGSREGLDVQLCVDGLQRRLPPAHEEALFRIAQEALNNVSRHAQAQRVRVMLAFHPTDVELSISDDGAGFPATLAPGGFGLTSMRERAEQLGGDFTLSAGAGSGTRVQVRVPAPAPTTSISA